MESNFYLCKCLPVLVAGALLLPLQTQAQQSPQSSLCVAGTAQAEVESGNIKTTMLNAGDMFWNLNDARFEVPKGSGKHSIFAGAMWIGGIDQATGQLALSAQTFRQGNPNDAGFWPGPLGTNGQTTDITCSNFDFIAKAHASVVNAFRDFATTAAKPIPDNDIPAEIMNWPGAGNPFRQNLSGVSNHLAPFVDVNNDGIYDPRQGDYPIILGDQCLYTITNDAGGIKQPVSQTIGLEVHTILYGFDAPTNPAVANTIFARYILINRGGKTLQDTYFGKWVDFDLGFYEDDYIGSDSARSMFYAYNGDANDEGTIGYGLNPPAQGVVFLNHPLTNFTYFNNDFSVYGNPDVDTDYYNYMRSHWKNGNPVTFGGYGTDTASAPTKLMYSGDPESGTGWTEASVGNLPGDRRGIGAHGPFTFAPGQIMIFDVAYPWAQGNNNLNSVTALKNAADVVKNYYDSNVVSARPTDKPALAAQIFPNPATQAAEVVLPATSTGKATYTLRDVTGRTVLQLTEEVVAGQPQKLDLQQIAKGMYLLQVQNNGQTFSSKLIKQ